MADREKLAELVNDILCFLPWGEVGSGTTSDIADHLIANGVVICGSECDAVKRMKQRIIDKLAFQEANTLGAQRALIGEIMEMVSEMDAAE